MRTTNDRPPFSGQHPRSSSSSFSRFALRPWLWSAVILAWLGPQPTAQAEDLHLTFGLYSSKKPTEMVKQYRPLLTVIEARLTEKLKQRVSIHTQVVKTYEEGIAALVEGKFDFSQVGPVSYVQAKSKKPDLTILAVEGARGGRTVNGIICVLSNSSITEVKDLKGHSFAFGDQFSTTGRYNSQMFLLESGIMARDLKRFDYLERHDRVGAAVAAGEFDAGALNERTFKKMNQSGAGLRAIAQFPIAGRPWVARSELPGRIVQALRQTLIETKDEEPLAALGEENLAFFPGEDQDYASTRIAVDRNDRFFQ